MEKIPVKQISAHLKEINTSNFSIRRVESLFNGNHIVQPLHRHNFYFILFLEKGGGTHEIDFNTYAIADRSVFVMKPGQAHKLTLTLGSAGYLLEFDAEFYSKTLNQNLNRIIKSNHIAVTPEIHKRMKTTFDNMYDENINKYQRYLDVIKAYLDIFFMEIIRISDSIVSHKDRHANERLDDFLNLIERDISEHKDVSYYANELNLSSYQLNAVTKSLLQKSASDVIIDHIILEAKRYLIATSNQINQIAWHLGYDDVSYFVRFFKKHTGYTPEVFRQNSI